MSVVVARSKVFYGWWVVAGSSAVNAFGGGVYFYGFSIFFLPIKEALNLTSAATSLVFSLSRAEGAFEGPISGYLIDRFGPRRILTIGVVFVGGGYVLLSQVNSYLGFLLVYLGVISLAFNGAFSGATMASVNSWFIRRKGLAMAVSSAAYGLGGAIVPPVLGLAVVHLGWRMSAALAGIFIIAVVIPAAQLLRRSPESMGLRPDGDEPGPPAAPGKVAEETAATEVDFTVKEAVRTPTLWILAVGNTLRNGALGALVVHFVPIMVWKGVSEPSAAFMLGAMSLMSIPTRIGMGWLSDRWSRPRLLAAGMVLGAAGMVVLNRSSSLWQIWAFIGMFSMVEGLGTLNWAMVGEFYGRRHFATLRGIVNLVGSWGMVVMPFVAGIIFDRTGSYTNALWIWVVTYLMAMVLFTFIRRPRAPARFGPQQSGRSAGHSSA